MLEVLIIRPGSTNFDEEGRIKGSLDIPISDQGKRQAERLAESLQGVKLDCLYVAPCDSAKRSADAIAERTFCRRKTLESLKNLDHGLWQGKLLTEVKRLHPKVYRQFQEHPTDMCPPNGETIQAAVERVRVAIDRLRKKHDGGRIGLVVPQPMASVVRYSLVGGSFGDIWKSELDFGTYETLRLEKQAGGKAFSLAPV